MMALPPWTVELIRRGLTDVARKAGDVESLGKLRSQASEILGELPETAARGIESVIRSAESSKKSVQRWARKHTALSVPVLNATGVLLHPQGSGVPIAPLAAELGHELLLGDGIRGAALEHRLTRRFARVLPSGDHSLAVANSFSAALTALPFLLPKHQLVVHRHHAVRLPGGLPLPDACGLFAPVIHDVGSVDRIDPQDFDGLENFCVIMADVGSQPISLLDSDRWQAIQTVVLPIATVRQSALDAIPSAESMLAAGAKFVILPGDGVCGGPQCGIIVGRQAEIEQLKTSAAWRALRATDAVTAMLLATLEIGNAQADQIPINGLLNAGIDNLNSRLERMATRLGGSEAIAEISTSQSTANLTATGRWSFPSCQLRLKHQSLTAEAWQKALLDGLPAVLTTVEQDRLCVDLRWIAAADDGRLAETLE
jgi:L-seryl-tRNA(Ser) seleniumtransferase